MPHAHLHSMVLSVYLNHRGFTFVLFEGPESPFDWGARGSRQRTGTEIVAEVKKMIDRYRPEVLVIEDTSVKGSRRTPRIRRMYRKLMHLAQVEYVDLCRFSRAEVRGTFVAVGASTKYEIAKAIAAQVPAFAHRVPRPRKAWEGPDRREHLFDAAALGLTFYARGMHNGGA